MNIGIADGQDDGVMIYASANEETEYSPPDNLCEVRIYQPEEKNEKSGEVEVESSDLMIVLSLDGAEALADALQRWAARRRTAGATA